MCGGVNMPLLYEPLEFQEEEIPFWKKPEFWEKLIIAIIPATVIAMAIVSKKK